MKKNILAIALFLGMTTLWSCSQSEVVEDNIQTPTQPAQSGPKVTISADGDIFSPTSTRAVFKTDASTAFPTLQNLTKGQKVKITCILRSDNAAQPITKVQLDWDILDDNHIRMTPDQAFNMAAGTDLSLSGNWYMMGIMGGTPTETNGTITGIQFKRYMEFKKPGDEIDADIPFVFGWRSLALSSGGHFETKTPIDLYPMGTFVWLKVTNNTPYSLNYSGVRMISSSPTEGSFDLTDSGITPVASLSDTPRGLASSDERFSNFLTFNGQNVTGQYQGTNGFKGPETSRSSWLMQTTGLFYNDASIGSDITLAKGATDKDRYLCVWIMPKKQKISVYSDSQGRGENDIWTSTGDVQEVMKTQFMLHSSPTDETNAPAMNMLPVFGTKDNYVSGQASPILDGKAVYNPIPLQYMAKLDNITPDENYSDDKAVYANTTLYNREQMQAAQTKVFPSDPSSNYMMPGREYWQAIMSPFGYSLFQGLGAAVLRNNYNSFMTVSNYRGKTRTYMTALSSQRWSGEGNAYNIAYAICLSKPSPYMQDAKMGDWYIGARQTVKLPETNSTTHAKGSGILTYFGENGKYTSNAPAVTTTDEYKHIIRASVEGLNTPQGRLKLEDRYLGESFILDMSDIAEEKFWETQRTSGKKDIYRYLPLSGNYTYDSGQKYSFKGQGVSGQYWINENMLINKLTSASSNIDNAIIGNAYLGLDDENRKRVGQGEMVTRRAFWSYCAISINTFGGAIGTHVSGYYNPFLKPIDPLCRGAIRLITRRPSVD